jgi:hypothetical protein
MWMYDSNVNIWTWMNGPNTTEAVGKITERLQTNEGMISCFFFWHAGSYEVKGRETSTTTPGARMNSATWVDLEGNLWLFGGFGFANSSLRGHLSDMWKYETSTNTWVWMHGFEVAGEFANYGTKGSGTGDTIPGSRQGAQTWTDLDGNLWLFGGVGLAVYPNYGKKSSWRVFVCFANSQIDFSWFIKRTSFRFVEVQHQHEHLDVDAGTQHPQ